jgi:glutamyl-tRNA synthetase
VAVGEYREKGIPGSGLLNYLVRFGWSHGDEEIFSVADLIQKFDWEHCGKGDGKYDPKKFTAIVFEHLKRSDLTSDEAYAEGVLPFLAQRGLTQVDRAKLLSALPLVRERAETFVLAADALDYFFRDIPVLDEKAAKKFLVPEKTSHLGGLRAELASAPVFEAKALEAHVTAWLAGKGLELKDVAQAARVAITGRAASPGLFEVIVVLGKDAVLARLDRAIAQVAAASA